jgi:TPR repeat protein
MIDKKSWKVILDMAKAGDPTAMVEAGDYFADGYEDTTEGIIVKQDEKKAFKMYFQDGTLSI